MNKVRISRLLYVSLTARNQPLLRSAGLQAGVRLRAHGGDCRPCSSPSPEPETILHLEQSVIGFIRQIYGVIGWPGVVLMMAIESAAIPFPSEVIMPLAGWFLIRDRGLSLWWLPVAALLGALGNTLGSWLTYWIGQREGGHSWNATVVVCSSLAMIWRAPTVGFIDTATSPYSWAVSCRSCERSSACRPVSQGWIFALSAS